jgi:hypothetical protein
MHSSLAGNTAVVGGQLVGPCPDLGAVFPCCQAVRSGACSSGLLSPLHCCPASSTTPDPVDRYRRVRVTHPFHPLAGRDFEFVAYRQNWGEDRVHLHDENGQLFSLPAAWTDVAAADPFVVIAAGRCPFTTDGLLALADLVGRLRARRDDGEGVKKIMP